MKKIDSLNSKRLTAYGQVNDARALFQRWRNLQVRESRGQYDAALKYLEKAINILGSEPIQDIGLGVIPR